MSAGTAAVSRWDTIRNPGFPQYIAALFLTGFGVQMQTVAVGWQVYDLTRDPFDLGLVGLSQFAPALLLVLVTGALADRFPRRVIMSVCLGVKGAVAAGLLAFSAMGDGPVGLIFLLLICFGIARAFYNPARQALVTNLVPADQLPRALATNSSVMQTATICGPVIGGLLYGVSPMAAYGTALAFFLAAALLIASIPRPAQSVSTVRRGWAEITAGFRYIMKNRIVLGAASLDLFVVLLGGAYALLPVYARDVLDIGSVGLGILRAAPAVGAIAVGLTLMTRPVTRNVGHVLFASVAVFALATLVFALSELVWLSILALVIVGGSDMVSVLIRSALVQLYTPDDLRGRVNAVNQVFVGASNELGGFRAGTTAALTGPIIAVAGGAVAALVVCGAWAKIFPELRSADRMGD